MTLIVIALKDIRWYFRSAFALGMMFAAPLLITGLLYFAFGSIGKDEANLSLPPMQLSVVNLDQPDPQSGLSIGQMLVEVLHEEELASFVEVTGGLDEAGAWTAVERREVDAALIIPPDFTAAAFGPGGGAQVSLVHDPTLTVGPGIVKTFLEDLLDGFAGAKIAVQVAEEQTTDRGKALQAGTADEIVQRYIAWVHETGSDHGESPAKPAAILRTPGGTSDLLSEMLGPVMAGMMIVFVFFTGASSASSILQEDQNGTLARLFTTPTSRGILLGGKLLAVLMILVVQTAVLVAAAALLFGIHWGNTLAVVMAAAGMILAAGGFGIFLISFLKNMQQTGPIMGGVMTLTSMIGGLFTTAIPNVPPAFAVINLTMPQGWALRAWRMALYGAGGVELIPTLLVLCTMGVVFFSIGLFNFQRRFAASNN